MPSAPDERPVAPWALVVATLALFLVWSNTWLVFEVLLAPKSGAAPMTWLDLLVARFSIVSPVCAAYCLALRRRESVAIVRRHPVRLLLCGLLSTPVYNGVVYYSMAHHVKGPVASLISALAPLYLVVIGALFLGERVTARKALGLVVGFGGVALVATAHHGGAEPAAEAAHVLILAAAPVAWAAYTALTKPIAREVSPLLWSYLVLAVGGAPLLPLLPFHGGPAIARLDGLGVSLLLYLALLASVFGNAVWSWLLRHLPASTTGFTVFLNPPMTAASKAALSVAAPARFSFAIVAQEWLGGGLALLGVALAVFTRRRPHPAPAPSPAPPASEP